MLAIAGFLASALVTQRVIEGIPHIEDEIVFVWQARALIEGHLTISSPPPSSLPGAEVLPSMQRLRTTFPAARSIIIIPGSPSNFIKNL